MMAPRFSLAFAALFVLSLGRDARAVEVRTLSKNTTLEEEIWEPHTVYRWDSLSFPPEFSRATLQTMLQTFFDRQRGRAFRTIGDPRDFNHGHFVRDKNGIKGILFHTQERALNAGKGSPFSFVDQNKRNWFAALDRPTEFVNAETLRYRERPADWPEAWERQTTWYQYLFKFHTITVMMLDPEKTGIEALPYMGSEKGEQFNFSKTECPLLSEEKLARSNVLTLNADGGRQCLYVSDFKCLFTVHFKCGGVPLR